MSDKHKKVGHVEHFVERIGAIGATVLALFSVDTEAPPPEATEPIETVEEEPDESVVLSERQLATTEQRAALPGELLKIAEQYLTAIESSLSRGPVLECVRSLREALNELGSEAYEEAERKRHEWPEAEERGRLCSLFDNALRLWPQERVANLSSKNQYAIGQLVTLSNMLHGGTFGPTVTKYGKVTITMHKTKEPDRGPHLPKGVEYRPQGPPCRGDRSDRGRGAESRRGRDPDQSSSSGT